MRQTTDRVARVKAKKTTVHRSVDACRAGGGARRHTRLSFLLFGLAGLLPLVSGADTPDPFALQPPLTNYAVFSCQSLTINGNCVVDSTGIVGGSGQANHGHVRSNGNITINGNSQVKGDATAGPGKQVTVTGNSTVTGVKSSATVPENCSPIDLAALKTVLLTANDNAQIPHTTGGKNPLGGADGRAFTLNGNDSIRLPAGTYLFSALTLNGNSSVAVSGPVRILCYGSVIFNGGSQVNQAGSPLNFKLWVSGATAAINGPGIVRGFIYAPNASTGLNGGALLIGAVYAQLVNLNGGSSVTRLIDDDPPTLQVTSPIDGSTVPACAVQVTGQISDAEGAVTLTINGAAVSVATDGSFAATVTLTTGNPSLITIQATDAVGNVAQRLVHVTVTPPVVTFTAPPPGLLGSRIITLTGSAGTATAVTVNGVPATVASGAWTFANYDLGVDGLKTLPIVGSNCVVAPPLSAQFDLDTQAPVIAIDSPRDGATMSGLTATVTGRVSDAHLMFVAVNGVPAAVANGRFAAPNVPLQGGRTDLIALATDALGRSSQAKITVQTDALPPVVTIDQPSAACLAAGQPRAISGSFSDPNPSTGQDGHPPAVQLQVQPAGGIATSRVGALSADGRNWSAADVDLGASDGTASLTVTATDLFNNVSRLSRSWQIDATPPTVALTLNGTPFPGSGSGDPAAGAQPTLLNRAVAPRATASDPGGIASPTVQLTLDGAPFVSGTPISAEGSHTLLARATDCASHEAKAYAVFRLDLTPPALVSTNPAEGAVLTAGIETFTGTSDPDLATATVGGKPATVSGGTFALSPFPWLEGANQVAIELTDLAGNRAAYTRHFTVRSLGLSVEILESGLPIVDGALFTRAVSPVVRASDPKAAVTATLNGTPFASGTAISRSGLYALAAIAADGVHSPATITRNFRVDLDAGPKITIGSPADGATVAGLTVDVTGTVSGNALSVTVNSRPATVSGSSWSVTGLQIEPDVITTITAIATDAAGRHASTTVSVRATSGGPRVLILQPAMGAATNRAKIDVVGAVAGGRSATADGTVTVAGRQVGLDSTGGFRAVDVPLLEGTNTVVAEATDVQGRSGHASVDVTADLTAPTMLVLADGQPLAEGATFGKAVALHVEVADNLPPVPAPEVRLNGQLRDMTGPALDISVSDGGGYILTVVAHDRAGNETRIERSFVVDLAGCSLTDVEPADGSSFAQVTVTIRGRSGAAKTVAVRVPVPGSNPTQYQEYPTLLADGTFVAGDVPLAIGDNALQILCTDPGGQSHTQDLHVRRLPDGGPVVHITSPNMGQLSTGNTVALSGTVSDPTAAVTVNSLKATVDPSSGAFAVATLPLAEGPNVLAAQAVDGVGRSGADRVVVWRDSLAPKVQITSPDNNARVGQASGVPATVDVTGLVDIDNEPNLAGVVVSTPQGSVTATVDPATGAFLAAAVPLDPAALAFSPLTITATASDALGHVATSSINIYLDTTGPSVILGTPTDLARYTEVSPGTIPVAGEAWVSDGAGVSVNGAALDPSALSWQPAGDGRNHAVFTAAVPVPSQDGTFGIVARVTALDGRWAQVRRLQYKDSVAPRVVEMAPGDGATGVDPNSLLMVLFSESVLHSTLTGPGGLTLVRVLTGDSVVGQVAVAGNAVAFVPGSALAAGESYRFDAGQGITDLVGHPLQQAKEVTFTVALSATDSAPTLDLLASPLCASSVQVKGATTPNTQVRVRDGDLAFSDYSDATGRFTITVPLAANGYHLLHVFAVTADGSANGREAIALLRVDCSAPTVTAAAFDRTTATIAVTFSEAIDPATLAEGAAGAAVHVSDAEDAARTPQPGALALSADGLTATIALDTADSAWWRGKSVRLDIGSPAADLKGNVIAQAYETVFFPTGGGGLSGGFLAGEAFDDASGRPLAGARVRLYRSDALLPGAVPADQTGIAVAETTTDGRGRYTMAGDVAAGRYAVLVENDGYSRAVRRLALEPATGAVPFDTRLTPLADPAGSLDPAVGGTFSGPTGSGLVLAVAPAAVPQAGPLTVRLTPIGGQGLPDLLPLGWTPAAAAEVRLATSDATLPDGHPTPFATDGVRLTVQLSTWVQSTDALVAVRFELATGQWVTLGTVERLAGSQGEPLARVALDGPGTVALVRADENDATKPPLPGGDPGEPLLGAATPAEFPQLTAALTLDPAVVAPTGRATARVVARSADGTTPWPSGLAVQACFDERLVLAGGGELLEAPFSADLVLYHPRLSVAEQGTSAPESAGVTEFHVSPSPKAAQVLLEVGWENIKLYAFPEELERGSVLGPAGGSVTSPDGVELSLAEGALTAKTVVKAHLLSASELAALPAVTGYATLAAVGIDLARQTLARAATVKLSSPAGTPPEVAGDPRIVIAELVEAPADGRPAFARLAACTSRVAGVADLPERIVGAPEPPDGVLPVEGIVREGTYLVLAAQAPIGFATGFVRTAGGAGLELSRVVAEGLGTADLSRDGGRYCAVVPAGANRTLTASHPTLGQGGTAVIATLANGAVVTQDIVVRPVPPAVTGQEPAPDSTDQPVGSIVSVSFSKQLDRGSVTSGTLRLELADASGQSTGVSFDGTVSLSPNGASVVFTPQRWLPPGRTFVATLAGGVRDTGGTPYAGPLPLTWRFSTSTVVAPGGQVHPEKFHIRMPVDGVAQIYGDPGAVPVAGPGEVWTISPVVEGRVADPERDSFNADSATGAFTVTVGHPPDFPVTIASRVWVKVVTSIDPEQPAAYFRLGPFATPDGKGFVAPPGEAVTFTTGDGIGVDVPASAFNQATAVTVTTLPPDSIGVDTPNGVRLGAYINVDFAGEAHETLRLRVPAPSDAVVGARAIVATPIDLPWGRKLRLLDIGAVVADGNTKLLSNGPELQAEPSQVAQGTGSGSIAATGLSARALDSGGGTCRDAKQQGLSRCFVETIFMELSASTTAAWFFDAGGGFALLTGSVSEPAAAQFSAFYNDLSDAWVYLPVPHDWNGHYILPVPLNTPLTIVRRDAATGWIVNRQEYDQLTSDPGGLIEKGLLPDTDTTQPLLIDARPFAFTRFRSPSQGVTEGVTLDVEAKNDRGTVTIQPAAGFTYTDGTRLDVWDYAPPAKSAGAPVHLGSAVVSGQTWQPMTFADPKSDELLLVVSPTDLDWEQDGNIELQFDHALKGLDDTQLQQLFVLSDETQGGTIPITVQQPSGNTSLLVLPNGALTAGHHYRLVITKPDLLVSKTGKPFWGEPHEFFFGVRAEGGAPVVQTPQGTLLLGDTNDAVDLLSFGNLLMVGSGTGRLVAVDRTQAAGDSSQIGSYRIAAIGNGQDDQIRSFATDGHNRLFYNELSGATWGVKAVRLEDVRNATAAACSGKPSWADPSVGCFDPVVGGVRTAYAIGQGPDLSASEWLALSTLPAGTPVDMEVLVQDDTGLSLGLDAFFAANAGHDRSVLPDGTVQFTITVASTDTPAPGCSAEEGQTLYQRATVDNLTTGQSWSTDVDYVCSASGNTTGTKDLTIRARPTDTLRLRRNISTLGYLAVIGSGITVVDLNRAYRVPQPGGNAIGQCGRRVGKYEGADLDLTPCTGSNVLVDGLAMTPSVAVHSKTGCVAGKGCSRGDGIDIYSPLLHIGLAHSGSTADAGAIQARGIDCLSSQLRDVALVNDVPGTSTSDLTRDVLFVSLGAGGIRVYDVSERATNLVRDLTIAGHSIYRLQADPARGLLFAGGNDDAGAAIIDVWDVQGASLPPSSSTSTFVPRPIMTLPNLPWNTNHLAIDDTGTGLLDTWDESRGAVSAPFSAPHMIFTPLVAAADPTQAVTDATASLVPLGVPVKPGAEATSTAAFTVRVALPGSLGPELTIKVQGLRMLPEARLLGQEDVGATPALPGGPGWPAREVFVTLRRVGGDDGTESGRYSTVYNLYESVETVVLEADPRARHAYTRQISDGTADEKTQCRRCDWPAYLPTDGRAKELLAGGAYVRAFLAVDPSSSAATQAATQAAAAFFEGQRTNSQDSYRAPYGVAELPAWADDVPSPIQVSQAEPAANPAVWSPGEAGVGVSLVGGDALLAATDFAWQGRALTVSLDRTYRSGSLGYGPLGSAGWHGTLFAHLREFGTTGEVEYHDGTGNVYRLLPRGTSTPAGYDDDPVGSYFIPKGLFMRLVKLSGGSGWRLYGPQHDSLVFDGSGRLVEISDRLRQNADPRIQGNTIFLSYDSFGQLVTIEDDLGLTFRLEYFDDPNPTAEGGDGERYGLLKHVTDFASRTVEYEFTDDRTLAKVKLPEVSNPVGDYAGFSYTGDSRPTVTYRYAPAANVTSSEGAATAILHGAFAPLRLEGSTQPGTDVLRARFEYDQTTGRATAVSMPDPGNQNSPGSSVRWGLAFPSEPANAAPATKATVTAPWGHVTEHTLSAGRSTQITEKAVETASGTGGTTTQDLTTAATYDATGRLSMFTREDGTATTYGYASGGDRLSQGNVTAATTAGITTTYEYNGDNIPQAMTDGESRRTTFAVPSGDSTPITAGYQTEGVLTTSTFDRFGRATHSETAGTSAVASDSTFGTDANGRAGAGLLDSSTSGGVTDHFSYDSRWDLAQRDSSYGVSTTLGHDDWGRTVEELGGQSQGDLAPVGAHVQRAYDAAGRLTRERRLQTGIGWVETQYEYNARDQVTTTTQTGLAPADAASTSFVQGATTTGFDQFGRVASTTSAAGVVTTTTYDSAGRVASTQTGVSGARQRGYDALNRLVFTTDGHEGSWEGAYDLWGRLAHETQPSGAFIEREYDNAGGIKRESVFADATKAAKLAETTFTTTSFGAVGESRELISGGASPDAILVTTHTFDGSGRITDTRRGPDGSQRLEQHLEFEPGTGRTLRSTDAIGNQMSYVYGGTLPWANQIVTSEPAASSQPAVTTTTTLTYDALGRVVHEDRAGTVIDRAFDEAGNLLSSSTGGSNQLTTTYDSRGLARSVSKPGIGGLVATGYDPDGRLLATNVAREGGATETTVTTYDASGRMATRTRPGSLTERFTYNSDDTLAIWTTRLANTAGEQLVIAHGYDAANRLVSRAPANPQSFDDAHRPAGLAPVDGGDVMTYDPFGRLTSSGMRPQAGAASPDPATLVTYGGYDTRGLPATERVGFWPAGSVIERHYGTFGNTIATLLPQGIAAGSGFAGHAQTFDGLDRLTSVTQANPDGTPIADAPFGATLAWSGSARPIGVTTPAGLATGQGFDATTGRLASLTVAAGGTTLGQLQYGWDVARDLKLGRAVADAGGLASGLGYAASYDAVARMRGADTGAGNTAGGSTQGTPLGSWTYGYGKADELVSITEASGGLEQYTSGAEGRITGRTGPDGGETFTYDAEGRRIQDGSSRATWDWRGRLVQIDPTSGDHDGERITYNYDAAGRLLSRTNLGQVPQGGTDADRPFIAKRAFVWDGQRMAAEAGLNFQDQPIWRQQYAPGQLGLDDAPLVRIEKDLQGSPTTKTYALIRDEMGTVMGVAEEQGSGTPHLLARYLYAPYGQRHTELGPELVRIQFDETVTKVGTTNQTPTAGQTVGGAIRIITTSPLAAATLTAGLTIEQYDPTSSSWQTATRTDFAIGTADGDATDLQVMRIQGWVKAARYLITLLPSLTDSFGRILILPSGESQSLAVEIDVPSDGTTEPSYARSFALAYDNAASDTLGGAFPGGQTSGFQGAWSDPVTNLGFHRARWLDKRNASWMSEDPIGSGGEAGLYRVLGRSPTSLVDPLGLYDLDIHFYAVYFLSRLVGFDVKAANVIAWSSQYVDDSSEGKPAPENWRDWRGMVNPFTARVAALHFPAPPYSLTEENSVYARAGARLAIRSHQLVRIGISLHTLADSFSHAGFELPHDSRNERTGSIRPNKGHADAAMGGHEPDLPYLHQEKARRMIGSLVTFLSEAYEALRGRTPNRINQEILDRDIPAALAEAAEDPLARAAYWQGLIGLRLNELVTYRQDRSPIGKTQWQEAIGGQAATMESLLGGAQDPYQLLTEEELGDLTKGDGR